MSSINEKLYGVAAVLRAQAGNVAVSMCNALTAKLAAIPNMNGKAAAQTFQQILVKDCSHVALTPLRAELVAVEVVEAWLRTLEKDNSAPLEYDFEVQDFFGVRSMSDEALSAAAPTGGLAILVKSLNEQGLTWKWLPRDRGFNRAKMVIVRS